MSHRGVWLWLPIALTTLALALGSPAPAVAAPVLTLSSPDDLGALTVGEQVRIDVTLQGLDVGNDFIFVLNSRVLFPAALFDPVPAPTTTSGLTPGSILTTAAQRSSFDAVSSLTDGAAVGNFSDLVPVPSQAISQNGLFYSFLLEVTAPGSGSIALDPANTTYGATSTGFNLAPLPTGGPLAR